MLTDHIEKGIWTPLKNFTENYDIRCLEDTTCEIRNRKNRTKIKGSKNPDGYIHANHMLGDDGKYHNNQIHRLFMLHYFPIENENEMQVDHLNHIKNDNRLCNLEWVPGCENIHNLESTNNYVMDYTYELPEDAINVTKDLKSKQQIWFSPSTIHFYEQSTDNKFNIRKWNSNGVITYTNQEGIRRKITKNTVKKYIPDLTYLPIDYTSTEKNLNQKEHFYCQFKDVDQSKYFWEPLRFFEDRYEVADINGYGVIRNKNTKVILCGSIHRNVHEIKLRHISRDNKDCNYKYTKILTMHYYPNDEFDDFMDYVNDSCNNYSSNFTKIIDLASASNIKSSIDYKPVKYDKIKKLPKNIIKLSKFNTFYFDNVYYCNDDMNIYTNFNNNYYKYSWNDDDNISVKDIHGIVRYINKLELIYTIQNNIL